MNPSGDLGAPVTRGELQELKRVLEQTIDDHFDRLDKSMREYVVEKIAEQNEWFGNWLLKQEQWLQDKFAKQNDWFAQWRAVQDDVIERRLASQHQILRQHANAIVENQLSQIGALDDKYSSLPAKTAALEETVADLAPRVAVLERKVFAPPARRPTKRATRRRR